MKCIIIDGRVGKNGAEIKTSKGGKQYLKFSLANNSFSGGQNKTTWFDVISYEPRLINGIGPYLKKGSCVNVRGDFEVTYNVDQNNKVWINQIITAEAIEFGQSNRREDDNSGELSTYTGTTKQQVDELTTNMPTSVNSGQIDESTIKAYAETMTTTTDDVNAYSGESDDLPF